MKYLLDTNICIYALKNKPAKIAQHLASLRPIDVGISVITVAELRHGASKSLHPIRNHRVLNDFFYPFFIEPFTTKTAEHYGKIVTYLEKKGTPIGPFDLLIAAHAITLNVTLVTNNVKEFKRVPKLKYENWVDDLPPY